MPTGLCRMSFPLTDNHAFRQTAMNVIKEVDRILVASGVYSKGRLRQDLLELLDFFGEPQSAGQQINWRSASLELLRQCFMARLRELHAADPLVVSYDEDRTSWHLVGDLLQAAHADGKEGAVAKHLVGAKLALRFPELKIRNKPSSAADVQVGEHGDFQLHDTVFHVTVSPMPALYEKCGRNLRDGLRVYVLVPERVLAASRELAEQSFSGQLQILSIESFVSQNIDEISEFSTTRLRKDLYRLLFTYNDRISAVEADKSLLIEIPQNLSR